VAHAPLTVLFAPDSFKGSLTSVEVARALATGWARARPHDELLLSPLADGGEGRSSRRGGRRLVGRDGASATRCARSRRAGCDRPTAARRSSRWLRRPLSRVRPEGATRSQRRRSGQGADRIAALAGPHGIVGIGGATTDGGRGLLAGLAGAGDDGGDCPVDLDAIRDVAQAIDVEVACDVANPLLGPTGAAATYGPQKGATLAQVDELDRRLAGWSRELAAMTGRDDAETPGAGAAGGVGYALLSVRDCFRAFHLRPGVELV
jgi:glycerate kinase